MSEEYCQRETNAIVSRSMCEHAIAECGQRDTEGDHELILSLDHLDAEAVFSACRRRVASFPLPRGNGNIIGRVLAEICRGWEEFVDHPIRPPFLTEEDDNEGLLL